MEIYGHQVSKNTKVSISLGALFVIIATVWTALDIGRPLFASDLVRIENKIDSYQNNTAIQILFIRREALESDLRAAKRDQSNHAKEDIDIINGQIKLIDAKILCYRTVDCIPETEI